MTLTTHAVVGASLAQFFPNHPVFAFAAGFISHFVLDTILHKDYDLTSFKKNKNDSLKGEFIYNKKFIFDLAIIFTDFILGFILVYVVYIFKSENSLLLVTLSGAIGAVLPDALQFVYFNFRHEPLITLQKFHLGIQHEIDSYNWGIFSQSVVGLFFILLALTLR